MASATTRQGHFWKVQVGHSWRAPKFLLRVDRNYRRPSLLKRLCLLIDMLKLRIPIRMAGPLPRFPVRLQTVVLVLQNVRNRRLFRQLPDEKARLSLLTGREQAGQLLSQ